MSTTISSHEPRHHRHHRAVAVHTQTEVLGLALVAGAILFTLAAGLATGIPMADAAFLLPAAVLPAAGAGLAWRFGTWGRAVGLVLGLAGALMTFWLAFGLFVPASFIEFTSAVAFVLGVPLMIGGMVAATRHRADLHDTATDAETRIDQVVLGIVAFAFLASLGLWLVGRTNVDASAASGLTEVTAKNFAFEDLTTTAVGGEVALVVRNGDAFSHTFTIDALGVDVQLLPGSSEIVRFAAAPGTWTFYCIPHSSEGGAGEDDMAATLTIR